MQSSEGTKIIKNLIHYDNLSKPVPYNHYKERETG